MSDPEDVVHDTDELDGVAIARVRRIADELGTSVAVREAPLVLACGVAGPWLTSALLCTEPRGHDGPHRVPVTWENTQRDYDQQRLLLDAVLTAVDRSRGEGDTYEIGAEIANEIAPRIRRLLAENSE
jgi:hypothetical protein